VVACDAGGGGDLPLDSVAHLAVIEAGGMIVVGTGEGTVDLVRLDPDGKLMWQSALGQTGDRAPARVLAAEGGGFLVVGTAGGTAPAFWLTKTTSGGAVVWDHSWPATAARGLGLAQLGGKELLVVGGLEGGARILLVTEDGVGEPAPAENFGPWRRVVAAGGGEGVVLGETGPAGDRDLVLRRVTPQGAVVWTEILAPEGDQLAAGLARTGDGGLVIGATEPGSATGVLLMRTTDAGKLLWSTAHPGEATLEVGVTPLGAYVMLARRGKGSWLARLDLDGVPTRQLDLPWEGASALAVASGGFLVAGGSASWIATDGEVRPCTRAAGP
jgi:outer membrane protein assembly factor BamB